MNAHSECTAAGCFIRDSTYHVLICRKCQYAVLASHVSSHLIKKVHDLKRAEASKVQQHILNDPRWEGTIHDGSNVKGISEVPEPIPGLPITTNGILCKEDPSCRYICCTEVSFIKHLRTHGRSRKTAIAPEKVYCQRFFSAGFGSHYFRNLKPPTDYPTSDDNKIQQAIKFIKQLVVDRDARISDRIQHGFIDDANIDDANIDDADIDDANSWLALTEFPRRFQGFSSQALRELIAIPKKDATGDEALVLLIWEATRQLVHMSQFVAKHASRNISLDVARYDRSPVSRPLQVYTDPASIQEHAVYAQQIMAVMTRCHSHLRRTGEHRLPFTLDHQQKAAIERLWQAARSHTPVAAEDSTDPKLGFTPLHSACLNFYIPLLSQTVRDDDWECGLVWACGVIANGAAGWMTAQSFRPILSSIMKVARSFVIYLALRKSRNPHEQLRNLGVTRPPKLQPPKQSELINGLDQLFDGRPTPKATIETWAEWVTAFTNSFLIRGNPRPSSMVWMMDVWMHACAITSSSTAEDRVRWTANTLIYDNLSLSVTDLQKNRG